MSEFPMWYSAGLIGVVVWIGLVSAVVALRIWVSYAPPIPKHRLPEVEDPYTPEYVALLEHDALEKRPKDQWSHPKGSCRYCWPFWSRTDALEAAQRRFRREIGTEPRMSPEKPAEPKHSPGGVVPFVAPVMVVSAYPPEKPCAHEDFLEFCGDDVPYRRICDDCGATSTKHYGYWTAWGLVHP